MGRGAAHGRREIGMGSSRRPDPALVEAGSGVEQWRSGAASTRRGEEGGGVRQRDLWRSYGGGPAAGIGPESTKAGGAWSAWDRGGARWGPVVA
jgi:hypothetical protein